MIAELAVVRRPRRRTHLADPVTCLPLCGTVTTTTGADVVRFDMAGGATSRLVQHLKRELDESSCLRCTRLAGIVLLCYGSRDTGRPSW